MAQYVCEERSKWVSGWVGGWKEGGNTYPKHGPGQRLREEEEAQGAGDGPPGRHDGRGVDGHVVEGKGVVVLVDACLGRLVGGWVEW